MLFCPRLVCGGTVVPCSSPGPRLPKPSGCWPLAAPGALLISPFNVRWRFSALAGDVEGSKLCLFSVIMPAKCVSIVSPRFHYRRISFCFLPLAAILESRLLNCMFRFLRSTHIVFHSSYTSLYFHKEYLLLLVFFMIAILTGVIWNLSMVFICTSFMARVGENFFSCLDFILSKSSAYFICPLLCWFINFGGV
jgi:hypothetical protein